MRDWEKAKRRQSGFTLLEMLITLSIVAILAGAAVMSLGGGQTRDADAAVRRLNARLQYAVDDALVTDRHIALIPDSKIGYRFVAWNPAEGKWNADPGPELANDEGADVRLQLSGLGAAGFIRFRPGGESDAFAIVLTAANQVWRINCDGINVTMIRPDAD